MVELSIVIVLYNEFEKVKNCINSVLKEKTTNSEILIIDNNSKKAGFEELKKKYPKIQFTRNSNNLGFARAANIGFKKSKGNFILLLTPDTIVLPGTIRQTLSYIKKNSQVGLVGCRVYSYPRHFHLSAFRKFPNLISHLYEYNVIFYKCCKLVSKEYHPLFYSHEDHQKILHPSNIIGAYLLLRKKAGKQVGFFNSDYYMYREETDLCKRLRKYRWDIVYLPVGGLVHFGGSQWRKSSITQCSPYYMNSTYTFFKKYHSAFYLKITWLVGFVSTLMSVPYLFFVVLVKTVLNKPSQSKDLIPCWISIFHWHINEGRKFIYSK